MNRRKFLALGTASVVMSTLPVMASEADISDKMYSMLMRHWFEFNDEITRNEILEETKEILNSSRIYDYNVCCDGSNNTADDIDNNMLNVDIIYDNKIFYDKQLHI